MNKDHIRHEVMPWVYTFLAIVAAAVSLFNIQYGLGDRLIAAAVVVFLVCAVLAIGYAVNGFLATNIKE